MRDRWKSPKQEGISRYSGRSAGTPLLLSSFYPGTKLLFWRRLFEFWKPVVKTMMRKSSRLFCVWDWFFLIFHPHSLMVYIPALLHSNTYLIFSQVSLKSLCVSGFYLLQLFFSVPLLTFNWNILQHLPFMSCLLASLGCPRRSLLALHTCSAPCLFYLYFLFFFTEQLCSSTPTVWLSPRLLLPRYLFPISLSKTSG